MGAGAGDLASAGALGRGTLRTTSRGRTAGAAAGGAGAALSNVDSGADRATGRRRAGTGERPGEGAGERRRATLGAGVRGAEGSLRSEGGDGGTGSGTFAPIAVSLRCFGAPVG